MPGREELARLLTGLAGLGPRRLIMLGIIGFTVFTAVGLAGMYLSQPQKEALYAGLETEDVTRIGAALNAAGVEYDISTDGKSVLVKVGHTARARMLLAAYATWSGHRSRPASSSSDSSWGFAC